MASSKTSHPALYRAAQFFAALKATLPWRGGGLRPDNLGADDRAWVNSILVTVGQQRLFARMLPNDQQHALAVAQTLRRAGYNHPALLQAALLHDVGKSLSQPIIHRVLIVLLNAFWPAALKWLSGDVRNHQLRKRQTIFHHSSLPHSPIDHIIWWRRPFVVHAQHPAIGAAWAQNAGCDPLAVSLIAKHQAELGDEATEELRLLAALQWADDLN